MRASCSTVLRHAVSATVAVVILGISARAADYYVNAVSGNDANTGTSPASAWRTITHALAQLPVPSTGVIDVVHVAPGLYDAALGETFPLRLMGHDAVQIVGDAGAESTILDGGGAWAMVWNWPDAQVYNWGTGPDTLLQGLTLRNAVDGFVLGANRFRSTYLTSRDLIVKEMSGHAIAANAGTTMAAGIQLWATFERVAIEDCAAGVFVTTPGVLGSTFSHANVTMIDCSITHCAGRGVHVDDTDFGSIGSNVALRRTRITENGHDGVLVEQAPTAETTMIEIQDSLIARNRGAGVKTGVLGQPSSFGGPLFTAIRRCTIAGNAGIGLDSFNQTPTTPGLYVQTTLSSSIVYGNGDDVSDNPAAPTIVNASYNDIGDGDYAGMNGNLAADPLFRNVTSGDYRLVWSSPCVDVGEPGAFPLDALDLQGANRNIDGNLDVVRRSDMGALEFAPLWPASMPHIGASFAMELWGPAGGTAHLFVMRGSPLVTPTSTPFGDLFLIPASTRDLGNTPVAPGPPALRPLLVPNDPALIGRLMSFQALSTSTVGLPASAYTNAATVRILP